MLSEIINVFMFHSINMQRQQINKNKCNKVLHENNTQCGTNILYCDHFVQCIRQYIYW